MIYFTLNEIALELGKCEKSVRDRVKWLNIKPKKKPKEKKYYFTEEQKELILNYGRNIGFNNIYAPEIIYVHTIWHIIPSKINYD